MIFSTASLTSSALAACSSAAVGCGASCVVWLQVASERGMLEVPQPDACVACRVAVAAVAASRYRHARCAALRWRANTRARAFTALLAAMRPRTRLARPGTRARSATHTQHRGRGQKGPAPARALCVAVYICRVRLNRKRLPCDGGAPSQSAPPPQSTVPAESATMHSLARWLPL